MQITRHALRRHSKDYRVGKYMAKSFGQRSYPLQERRRPAILKKTHVFFSQDMASHGRSSPLQSQHRVWTLWEPSCNGVHAHTVTVQALRLAEELPGEFSTTLHLHLFLDGKGFKNEHATDRGPHHTGHRFIKWGLPAWLFIQAEA